MMLGFASLQVMAQAAPDSFRTKLEGTLSVWLKRYPQEKVYLQFDKDYYVAGEPIWFKAYLSNDYHPDGLSTNLYVDLIDRTGKVVKKDLLPVIASSANGEFTLMPDFPPGDYRIRAYTSWMLNFDPGFLFEKDIHVYAPSPDLPQATVLKGGVAQNTSSDTASFSVQFFPEGGDLVDSLKSVVAFKAINRAGLPQPVMGKVYDDRGDTLADMQTVHDGMGSFELTPQPGMHYFAKVADSSGRSSRIFALPASKSSGIVLHLVQSYGRLFFQVSGNWNAASALKGLRLIAQEAGHLVYDARLDFGAGLTGGMVPVEHLPSGILQVTVFREDGVPLAERLFFVNNEDRLQMRLQADTLGLGKREKNSFVLELPDSIQGDFSVSVTDADQLTPAAFSDNIISHFLLTSDIKGYVNNPGWYFEKKDSLHEQALDLVMITNGWRRFAWKQIWDGHYPVIRYPAENLLEVRGRLIERKTPLADGKISFILKAPVDSQTFFINARADSAGRFLVDNLVFRDTAFLYYKAEDTVHKSRDVTVEFTPSRAAAQPYELLHRPLAPALISSNEELKNFLTLSEERNQVQRMINNHSVLLKEVTVKAKKVAREEKIEDRYTSGMFKGGDAYTFDLTKEIPSYTDILQYLQGRVAGLQILGSGPNARARWRGGSPGFYLDEVPVDIGTIATVPVTDIALVKVFRPPFMGGFGGGNGAIAVYTKRGGDVDDALVRGFTKTTVQGYTWTREFYSPDYSVKKEVNELADKRVTLYWNPYLITDSTTHSVRFSFYNNDITHRFRVVIEGMDNEGRPGRIEKVFE